MATESKTFNISVKLNGQTQDLKVRELETTDGAPYYSCSNNENEITQVRKENYEKWEQLWGQLGVEEIKDIGEAIDKQITPP